MGIGSFLGKLNNPFSPLGIASVSGQVGAAANNQVWSNPNYWAGSIDPDYALQAAIAKQAQSPAVAPPNDPVGAAVVGLAKRLWGWSAPPTAAAEPAKHSKAILKAAADGIDHSQTPPVAPPTSPYPMPPGLSADTPNGYGTPPLGSLMGPQALNIMQTIKQAQAAGQLPTSQPAALPSPGVQLPQADPSKAFASPSMIPGAQAPTAYAGPGSMPTYNADGTLGASQSTGSLSGLLGLLNKGNLGGTGAGLGGLY